ncbi:MAG: hypothetical protein EAZ97_12000 [Bacteroidetes bacterium]|nr:MAG: hypothetical protein EAZ97_12000 [Bacteroidota bacterium]
MAQEGKIMAKNSLSAEIMGKSLFFTINYDRIFLQADDWKFSGRLGFFGSGGTDGSFIVLPMGIYAMYGKNKHHVELGAGSTYIKGTTSAFGLSDNASTNIPMLSVGYRLQKPEGGFFLSATASLILRKEFFFFPWPGVNLGYSF